MRIYTAVETKTPYFKRDYLLCDFVVQAQRDAGLDFFESGVFLLLDRSLGIFFCPGYFIPRFQKYAAAA